MRPSTMYNDHMPVKINTNTLWISATHLSKVKMSNDVIKSKCL